MLPSKKLFDSLLPREAKTQHEQLTPLSFSSALTAQVPTGEIHALVLVWGFRHSWSQLSKEQHPHTQLPLMLSQPALSLMAAASEKASF